MQKDTQKTTLPSWLPLSVLSSHFVKEMREIFRQPTEEEIDDMYQQHLRDQAKASYNGQVPFKRDCNLDVDNKNVVHCMMVGTPGHECT